MQKPNACKAKFDWIAYVTLALSIDGQLRLRHQGVVVVGLEVHILKIRMGKMREETGNQMRRGDFTIRGFLYWRFRFRTVFDSPLVHISLLGK